MTLQLIRQNSMSIYGHEPQILSSQVYIGHWLLHILLSNFSTFLNSLQLSQISIHLSVICFKSPSMSKYLINNLSLTSSDLIIPVFTDIDLRYTNPQSSICLIYWVQPIVNCCHRILHHPVTAIAQTSNEQIIVIQQ